MATQVYNEEEITLQDETVVTLKPLVIGRLRRFMAAWKEFEKLEEDDDSLDVFINCVGIALEESFKDKFERLAADPKIKEEKGGFLSAEYKDYLESVIDMETIYKIMDVCGGMKLNDPNLLAAATRAAELGTT